MTAMRRLLPATLVALTALSGCGSEKPVPPQRAAATAPGFVVQTVDAPSWQSVSAEIATVDQARAMARIPGILSVLTVKDGDYVKKGQVIGRIVDTQLGYQSGAYGAQAAAAQAQAVQAQTELSRTRFLYDNGVYSKARLEQAQTAASAASAQVRAARQQQSAVTAVAGQGVVVAPSSGRVLQADVPAGSAVAPGMSIATITSGPVVLRLSLPESLVGQVHVGSAVIATSDNRSRHGTVIKVYPSVDSGYVRADATLPGLDGGLIGRRVAARVEAGTHPALLVPAKYVTTRFGIDYVDVRSAKGEIATVPVQTTPAMAPGSVEILSGVSAGDVLVAGAHQ